MNDEIPYNPPGMAEYIREGARKNSALLRKMQGKPEPIATAETKHVCISDLLAAETTLKALHDQMAAECQAGMDKWPRDWMQNHVNERAAIIKVRNILISRAEAANDKSSLTRPT